MTSPARPLLPNPSDAPVLTRDDLDPEAAAKLSTQDYSRKPAIEGVKLVELRRFSEDAGSFAEILRMTGGSVNGLDGFSVAQVNYSDMEPGAIKAWHVHFQQEDLWFVPPICKLVVGLHDLRRESSSPGVTQRMVLGDGRAQVLLIPRGVAHGAANLTQQRQILMYFVNSGFSAVDPDEHRLDPFMLGRAFWEMTAG